MVTVPFEIEVNARGESNRALLYVTLEGVTGWGVAEIASISIDGDPANWDHGTELNQARVHDGLSDSDTVTITGDAERTMGQSVPTEATLQATLIAGKVSRASKVITAPETDTLAIDVSVGDVIRQDMGGHTLVLQVDEIV